MAVSSFFFSDKNFRQSLLVCVTNISSRAGLPFPVETLDGFLIAFRRAATRDVEKNEAPVSSIGEPVPWAFFRALILVDLSRCLRAYRALLVISLLINFSRSHMEKIQHCIFVFDISFFVSSVSVVSSHLCFFSFILISCFSVPFVHILPCLAFTRTYSLSFRLSRSFICLSVSASFSHYEFQGVVLLLTSARSLVSPSIFSYP